MYYVGIAEAAGEWRGLGGWIKTSL